MPRRDFSPGHRSNLLQGETAQGTGQQIPAMIGAVSVPVNRKIIEPDFVRRTARLGEAAAEHEVPEAELLADEKHGFLEGRLRAHGKNLRKAHGPLVAHAVSLPTGSVPLFWLILYALAWVAETPSVSGCTLRLWGPLRALISESGQALGVAASFLGRPALTSSIVRRNIPSPS